MSIIMCMPTLRQLFCFTRARVFSRSYSCVLLDSHLLTQSRVLPLAALKRYGATLRFMSTGKCLAFHDVDDLPSTSTPWSRVSNVSVGEGWGHASAICFLFGKKASHHTHPRSSQPHAHSRPQRSPFACCHRFHPHNHYHHAAFITPQCLS
jgi:hypothetical protein